MTRPRPARDALAAHLGGHGLPASTLARITNPGPADRERESLAAALRALGGRYGPLKVLDAVADVYGAWMPLVPGTLPPAARTSDPSTSHQAAAGVTGTPTARNHMGRLLLAFLRLERIAAAETEYMDVTLTSEEAARTAIPSLERAEFAKRCSDLQALGYLQVARDVDGHERTRQGRSGRQRLVFELTPAGRALAQGIEVRAL